LALTGAFSATGFFSNCCFFGDFLTGAATDASVPAGTNGIGVVAAGSGTLYGAVTLSGAGASTRSLAGLPTSADVSTLYGASVTGASLTPNNFFNIPNIKSPLYTSIYLLSNLFKNIMKIVDYTVDPVGFKY
jgi:hypothetical protein